MHLHLVCRDKGGKAVTAFVICYVAFATEILDFQLGFTNHKQTDKNGKCGQIFHKMSKLR